MVPDKICEDCKSFSFIENVGEPDPEWGKCDKECLTKYMDIGDAKFYPNKLFGCRFFRKELL